MSVKAKLQRALDYSNNMAYYSPNNIRRLIISPYGAIICFHIGIKPKFVPYNTNDLGRDVQNGESIDLVSIAVEPKILASLEEIVILADRPDWVNYLYNPNALIKGYTGFNGDLKGSVCKRFSRLKGIYLVDNVNIKQYYEFVFKNKGYTFADETQGLHIQNCEIFNGNSWWKGYGSSGQFYELDRDGSPLNRHFKAIIEAKEHIDKATKVAEVKAEHDTDSKHKVEDLLRAYSSLLRGLQDNLCVIFANFDANQFTLIKSNELDVKDLEHSLEPVIKERVAKIVMYCNTYIYKTFYEKYKDEPWIDSFYRSLKHNGYFACKCSEVSYECIEKYKIELKQTTPALKLMKHYKEILVEEVNY